MKYIIDIPEEFAVATQEYWDKTVGLELEPYLEPDRECIENEVWEFVKEIILRDNGTLMSGMFENELNECFGYPYYSDMFANLSYQEAKFKYEVWLKQRNEIKIGDEVIEDGYKGIITYVHDELCDVLWSDGSVNEDRDKNDLFKTGRHFTGVVELLEKMKGEE